MTTKNRTCFNCAYMHTLPGTVHIQCRTLPAGEAAIVAAKGGWPNKSRKPWPKCGAWPLNFDANVILDCFAHVEGMPGSEQEGIDWDDPLITLASLLR
jgi:hypothetical protein